MTKPTEAAMASEPATIAIDRVAPVRLQERRCFECGRFWAYEAFHAACPECPVCAGHANDRLRAALEASERTIRSLRGALTRTRQPGGGGRR